MMFLFFSQNSYADCELVISHISDDKYQDAQNEFANKCKGQKMKGINLTTEEKDQILALVLNNMESCGEHYRLEEFDQVKKCVDNTQLRSAIEKADLSFKTNLKQTFDYWDRTVNPAKFEKEAEEYYKQKAITDKIEAQKIYKSGSDLFKNACGAQFAIDHHTRILKNRNKISSVYINKYEKIITFSKKILKEQKAEYLKRTGKPLNMAKCNN